MAAFSGPPQPPQPPQPNLENCEIKAVQSDRIIARGECIVMLPGAVPPVPAIPVQDLEGFNTQPHNTPRHVHVVMDTGEHVGVIDDDHSEYILPKFAGARRHSTTLTIMTSASLVRKTASAALWNNFLGVKPVSGSGKTAG